MQWIITSDERFASDALHQVFRSWSCLISSENNFPAPGIYVPKMASGRTHKVIHVDITKILEQEVVKKTEKDFRVYIRIKEMLKKLHPQNLWVHQIDDIGSPISEDDAVNLSTCMVGLMGLPFNWAVQRSVFEIIWSRRAVHSLHFSDSIRGFRWYAMLNGRYIEESRDYSDVRDSFI